jgi:hypothetical protein
MQDQSQKQKTNRRRRVFRRSALREQGIAGRQTPLEMQK